MKKLTPLLFILLASVSCQKDPDTSELSANFLVLTDYDTSEKFSTFSTYYLPDSILTITGEKKQSFMNDAQASEILNTVADNMNKCGYTRSADKESADIGLQLSYIESTYFLTAYSGSPYWGGGYYPGYWYPYYWTPGYWGWGGWYDWYYPYAVSYNYTTGSLMMEMIKLKGNDISTKKIPVIWDAYMSGLLYSSTTVNVNLACEAVDQAFEQSPYLKILLYK